MLVELVADLKGDGISLYMARVRTEIRDEMVAAGLEGRIGIAGVYLEVDDGVADYLSRDPGAGSDG
jgi:hypothetical protein